jgi:HD-GYP domain-containing protein (c-di-GMP phosphodiesterase class II)
MEAQFQQADGQAGLTIRFTGADDPSLVGLFLIQDGVFRYVNTEFASLLGYRPEELINRHKLRDVVAPDDWLGIERVIAQVLTGAPRALQASFTGRGKDRCCTPAFEAFFHYVDEVQPSDRRIAVENRSYRSENGGSGFQPRSSSPGSVLVGMVHDVTANQKLAGYLEQIRHSEAKTIHALARICEKRDPYTSGHQERASSLAVAIGRELGLDERRLEGLALGARIHDIGKIYIPAEILNRPGRLTPAEFQIIKTHPEVGYEIVKDIEFPWPIREIILQHHERLDGSGYPQGLKGDEIVLEARILAVADTVEAMSAHRPYRPAVGLRAALNLIQLESGRLYDPQAAEACLKLFSEGQFTEREFSADDVPELWQEAARA